MTARLLTSILLVPVLLCMSCQGEDIQSGSDVLLYDARDFYDKGEFKEAEKRLDTIIKKEPTNYMAKMYLANTYMSLGGVDIFKVIAAMVDMFASGAKDKATGSLVASASTDSMSQLSGLGATVGLEISPATSEKVKNNELTTLQEVNDEIAAVGSLSKALSALDELAKVGYSPIKVNALKGINYMMRALQFFTLFFDQDSDGQIDAMKTLDDLSATKDADLTDPASIAKVAASIGELSTLLTNFSNSKILDQFVADLSSSVSSFTAAGVPEDVTKPVQEMLNTIQGFQKTLSDTLGDAGASEGEGGSKFLEDGLKNIATEKVKEVYGDNIPADVQQQIDNLSGDPNALAEAQKKAAADGFDANTADANDIPDDFDGNSLTGTGYRMHPNAVRQLFESYTIDTWLAKDVQ